MLEYAAVELHDSTRGGFEGATKVFEMKSL